LWYKHA
jgi:nucleoside diphosphate kinase